MSLSTRAELMRPLSSPRRWGWLTAVLLATGLALGAPVPASAATVPSEPEVVSTSTTSASLDWASVSRAPQYRVKYSTSAKMKNPQYALTTSSAITLSRLDAGTRYFVKVRVVTAGNQAVSGYSPVAALETRPRTASGTASGATLRVGSYNVRCHNCTSSRANERTWYERRGDVVATIKSQDLDVLGVQEASQGWLRSDGGHGDKIDLSQFEDLRDRLGGGWELANANRNNCVKAKTPSSCDYKDQGASQGTKILYDSDRVELVSEGSQLLPSPSGSNPRYMSWAILRQLGSGKKFFLADAHLEDDDDHALHVKEAKVLADEVENHNPGLPTLIVGDMNSHKHTKPSNGVYDVLVEDRGYVDPLGNTWYSTSKAPGATVEKRINTWLSSWNDFERHAKGNPDRPNGTYLDYIFTSRGMRVPEWETVARLDSDGDFVGGIPSDHNLIRATVVLP